MSKLDHTEVVLNFLGKPMTEGDGETPLTFRGLAVFALSFVGREENLGSEKKHRCFHVAQKFFTGKRVNLTVDEAALIKERAGVCLDILPFGRLAAWLEGESQTIPIEVDGLDNEKD